jgi:hypothetical protein
MADGNLVIIKTVFIWVVVVIGVMGVLMLAVAAFLYLIAAGEEPLMVRANGMFWGGIGCLVGAVALYGIGEYLV